MLNFSHHGRRLIKTAGACLIFGIVFPAYAAEIQSNHPRLMLTNEKLTQLQVKKNANDNSWLTLKNQADILASYSIFPYVDATHANEPDNTIFYDYQGQGWFDATLPLGLAYKMTGESSYSKKLLELADEMIRAEADANNKPPIGRPPLQLDNYYATRYLGPVIAFIYDWCYESLGNSRKASMIALMNGYFDDMRANAYQVNQTPDGNYFPNHMIAAAYMGYASYGDNPRAQEMIDWARIRFDGTKSALVSTDNIPIETISQVFTGGIKPMIAQDANGPAITGAPWRGGFDAQGWAYGTQTLNALIDYLLVIKSATGEDLITPRMAWFQKIFRALMHGLMPDRFKLLPAGDWGSDYGAVISRSLPVRLASLLKDTADGPGAQHFAYTKIPLTSPYADFPDHVYQKSYQQAAWEEFFFGDGARASKKLVLPPYYSGFSPVYPGDGVTNGAIPYFYLRSDWTFNATWAFLHMGAAWYNDHQHLDAGNILLTHGADQLLVDASNWKGALNSIGIVGSSYDEISGQSGAANTLWFNDFGDFQRSNDASEGQEYYAGGQGFWGKDKVFAAEQLDAYSYLRSNLTSAYNHSGDISDQANRKLTGFNRTVIYLRAADIFLIYDQVSAVHSTHSLGQYPKYLRWHFPSIPKVEGNLVQVDQGSSRLYLQTLLPNPASITAVDESKNTDPCDGRPSPPCITYNASPNGWDANSGTWRIEVKHPDNPLAIEFLSVIQSGAKTRPAMTTKPLQTNDALMRGVKITQPNAVNIVFLSILTTPVIQTSYAFGGIKSTHSLFGMMPNAHYRVTYTNSIVTVIQDSSADLSASAAGALRFNIDSGTISSAI